MIIKQCIFALWKTVHSTIKVSPVILSLTTVPISNDEVNEMQKCVPRTLFITQQS